MNKIALGTVQFGLDYGINNPKGQVQEAEVCKILNYAEKNDIDLLDTSFAYGESETVLGRSLKKQNINFKIVTKLPKNYINNASYTLNLSLNKLKQKKIYGYILHHFELFKDKPEIWSELINLKKENKVEKIGFSLYYPSELDYLFFQNVKFDLVQIPYSIFDQRFAPYFSKLKEQNVEIHVRSVFLQGLVFKTEATLPEKLSGIKEKLITLNKLSQNQQIPISSIALNFAILNQNIDKVIIGVDSLDNLRENIAGLNDLAKVNLIYKDLVQLRHDDENIILPFNWK